MKQISGFGKALAVILLVAALILPTGMDKKLTAGGSLNKGSLPTAERAATCTNDEDYSISVLFFNWI